MLDISRSDLLAGVAGSGTMGRGIAQVLAQCGARVRVVDAQAGAAAKAKEAIARALGGQVQKGRMAQAEADAALGRIEIANALDALKYCHLVIEAIFEQLEAKQALFRQLEGLVSDTCILASNTSSLSVTALAAACARPGRVAGYHFFNPVPLMKIVEVVDGELTEPWVGEALASLAKRFGHTAVRCKDTPGFVVNHAGRGFVPESLRVLQEGVADFATIDRILVDAAGFRMGPFSLMDLVGLDVAHAVMKSMHQQYYGEPKYQPAYIAETRVAAGLLGRKTGRGWYRYAKDSTAEKVPEQPVPQAKAASVWVAPELKDFAATLGAKLEAKPLPGTLCLIAPLGADATTTALELGLDPRHTVAVDPLFGFSKRRTLMPTPVTTKEAREAAHGLLAADGVPVSVIRDSAGFVAQRVVAHVVNVGCAIVQERIAHPEDLDRAVMLGLGYPKGPLALGDAAGGVGDAAGGVGDAAGGVGDAAGGVGDGRGAAKILAILEAMYELTKEPRYRPSPWLTRRARLGVSLLTPE